jgi:hypothetical protein
VAGPGRAEIVTPAGHRAAGLPHTKTRRKEFGMPTQQTPGAAPGDTSTAEVAREQAVGVGKEAAGAGGDVARTAKEQGRDVVAEATRQTRDLAGETREQLRQQSVAQRDRAAGSLRTLGDELRQMADQGGQDGPATELAHQAADRVGSVARYLEQHEPGELVEQVRAYARRRPGTFLVGAVVAGALAGRLVKAARDDSGSDSTGSTDASGTGTSGNGQVQTTTPAPYPTGRSEPGIAVGGPAGVGDVSYPPVSPLPGEVGYPAAEPAYQQPYQDAGAGAADPAPGVVAPGQVPTDPSWRQDEPDRGWTP